MVVEPGPARPQMLSPSIPAMPLAPLVKLTLKRSFPLIINTVKICPKKSVTIAR